MEHQHCQEILGPLSEYISGEAAVSLCAEIEAHLTECKNCRLMVDTLKKTIILYRATKTEKLPDDIRRRLYHKLELDDYLAD